MNVFGRVVKDVEEAQHQSELSLRILEERLKLSDVKYNENICSSDLYG